MTYNKNRIEMFYLIILTVYFSAMLLNLTVLQMDDICARILRYVEYGCYFFAIIKIFLDSYDKKSFWAVCITILLLFIIVIQIDSSIYLYYLLMIIAARNVNIREILKRVCIVQGIILSVFIFASQMGWVENYFFLQNGRNRNSLGFLYTTYAPTIFFFFILEYIYLRKERMRIYEFAILEGVNYWLFVMTDSRVCFYLSTIVLVYVFCMRYFWQNRTESGARNKWLILTPSIAAAASIFLHAFYNSGNAVWVELDQFFNGRLNLGHNALNTYRITLFGQHITWIGFGRSSEYGTYNYVDNSYLKVLLDGGIVLLILVIAAYTYMIYMAVKTNNYYMQTILLFVIVFCITEARIIYLSFNPFILLIATAWRTKDIEKLDRKESVLACKFRMLSIQIKLKNRY